MDPEQAPAQSKRSAEPLSASDYLQATRSLWANQLRLVWPNEKAEIRRCVICTTDSFSPIRRCSSCGGETAGLHPERVVSGEEASLIAARRAFDKARRHLRIFNITLGFLSMLFLGYLIVFKLIFVFVLIIPTLIATVTVVGAAMYILRKHFLAKYGASLEKLNRDRRSEDPKMKAVVHELVEPFLTRNNVGLREPVTVTLEERELLKQAVSKLGVTIQDDSMLLYLTSCALSRDYEAFHEYMEHQSKNGISTIAAYLNII